MSADFTMERADGVTTIRLTRNLSLEELLDVVDEVAKSDDCRRRLWDVTQFFSLDADDIKKLAARGRVHWSEASRVAYVASDSLSYGLLRVFEVYREQENYETRVFREESEAREWLLEWAEPEPA